MSTPENPAAGPPKHQPFVPETMEMKEFTLRAVLLGLAMTVVLGAANAYLGLRAGITIAATYPAAVIGMAVLRIWKGSVLEENIARTSGTIGEGIAAGAIFTIPAFLMSKAWPSFGFAEAYWKTTALIMVGSVLGVLFISLVRRGMVEDPELPFPESVAAGEIHKAGRRGAQAAKYLFWNIGIGGLTYILGKLGLFAADKDIQYQIGNLGWSQVRLGTTADAKVLAAGGASTFAAPSVSPAYLGVGYIIGVRRASIQFAGSVLAWGLIVPLLIFLMGPRLQQYLPAGTPDDWAGMAVAIWRFIVRPIAVGGMLVGAAYTLINMRKSMTIGLGRAFADLRKTAADQAQLSRTERYMSSKVVFGLIAVMVVLGVSGPSGVATVLGVAAVVCVSSSVAGELLQDFKVGYILGGTPAKIQKAELIAVVVASLVMYFPLALLITAFGLGTRDLPAPQAGLMAALAQGIVGGEMPWPLVGVGIFFGIAMIMMQVRSPMLVAVGMYLPFETTFAIFVGGVFRSRS